MGCFVFCRTITTQYWDVANLKVSAEPLLDSFNEFATINELITGYPYEKSIEYLEYNAGSKRSFRQLAAKLEDGFYEGFSEVAVGSNAIPSSLIKSAINPDNPESINITAWTIGTLNYTEWVVSHLWKTYNTGIDDEASSYNEADSTFTFFTGGKSYVIDLTTIDSTAKTVEYSQSLYTGVVFTLTLPPEPIGDILTVYYQPIGWLSIFSFIPPRVWVYDITSDAHPELSFHLKVDSKDDLAFKMFPPLVVRFNNINYPDFTVDDEYKEYAETLGIDAERLITELIDNAAESGNDLNVLDHVTINLGVNLQAKDKYSLEYCIDFFDKLSILANRYPSTLNPLTRVAHERSTGLFEWYYDEENDTYLQNAYIMDEQNRTRGRIDSLGMEFVSTFKNFDFILKFYGISSATITDSQILASTALTEIRDSLLNADEAEYGKNRGAVIYGSRISNKLDDLISLGIPWNGTISAANVKLNTGETVVLIDDPLNEYATIPKIPFISDNIITYFTLTKSTGDIRCLTVVGPIVSHGVVDAASKKSKYVYIALQDDLAEIYIPLDWNILKDYRNEKVTTLTSNAYYMNIHYALFHQEKKWDVGALAFAWMLYTGDASFVSSLGKAFGLSVANATLLAFVLIAASMGVFGEKAQTISALVMLYVGFKSSGSSLGYNKATLSLAITAGDLMNRITMENLRDEYNALEDKYSNLLLEIEEEMDALTDTLEDLGYYKRQRDKKLIAISMLNVKKVDTFTPMHPKEYFAKYKNSCKVKNYYSNIYKYA